MANKKKSTTAPTEVGTVSLTKEQITAAALNDTSFSPDTFQLGDRTFPIKHLPYDDYTKFLVLLAPLADKFINKLGKSATASIPGIDLNPDIFSLKDVIVYCGENIPKLVLIACNASDPTVTIEQVKLLGKNPVNLAGIVIKQVVHNNMINDFASFFRQLAPTMTQTQSMSK